MKRTHDRVSRRGVTDGFSLVEVLVALVVLEIGLLAVLGMAVLAQRELAHAAALVRATGAAEAVADSLLARGSPVVPGERSVPPFRVRWAPGDGLLLEVFREEAGETAPPLLRLDVSADGTEPGP